LTLPSETAGQAESQLNKPSTTGNVLYLSAGEMGELEKSGAKNVVIGGFSPARASL